ncbi:Mov34/MPN/PAD-1 family protein [Leptolyngbya sp. AN02str]|uniref:Mov34/MPN/PAD-1 family protein n=1 Tax=Leptolyngbya sp. AN02str TaxID=3423363 RepID=UPI003D313E4F
MVLALSSQALQQVRHHAEQTYPEECCGLLLGTLQRFSSPQEDATRTVYELWQAPNTWDAAHSQSSDGTPAPHPSSSNLDNTRRYWIAPQQLLAAQRHARDRQLNIIGVYHSHPDHPAIPSECDRSFAWPDYSYIIVSVQQGSAQDLLCWSLDDQHQFQPEAIHLLTEPPIIQPIPSAKPLMSNPVETS